MSSNQPTIIETLDDETLHVLDTEGVYVRCGLADSFVEVSTIVKDLKHYKQYSEIYFKRYDESYQKGENLTIILFIIANLFSMFIIGTLIHFSCPNLTIEDSFALFVSVVFVLGFPLNIVLSLLLD